MFGWDSLANCYDRQDRNKLAKLAYERALALAQEFKDVSVQKNCVYNLVNLCSTLLSPDLEKYVELNAQLDKQ